MIQRPSMARGIGAVSPWHMMAYIFVLLLTIASCSTEGLSDGDGAADTVDGETTAQRDPISHRLPRMVDIGAGRCIPCKMMAPILEELKVEFAGRFDVEFIDVWKNPHAAKPYDIRLIPTQIFFDTQGVELFRHEGFYGREDILEKWRELGFDFDQGLP